MGTYGDTGLSVNGGVIGLIGVEYSPHMGQAVRPDTLSVCILRRWPYSLVPGRCAICLQACLCD